MDANEVLSQRDTELEKKLPVTKKIKVQYIEKEKKKQKTKNAQDCNSLLFKL